MRARRLVDADGLVLGRVATKAARLLMGKHRPTYTTFLDTGDHVVIVNAGGTPFDDDATVVRGSISEVLPALVG